MEWAGSRIMCSSWNGRHKKLLPCFFVWYQRESCVVCTVSIGLLYWINKPAKLDSFRHLKMCFLTFHLTAAAAAVVVRLLTKAATLLTVPSWLLLTREIFWNVLWIVNRLMYRTGTMKNWHKGATSELSRLLLRLPPKEECCCFVHYPVCHVLWWRFGLMEWNEYFLTD